MLNKTIKYFRTSHKMTQETLALKLGVTRQTVSKWENGISVPDADTLNKIADIFDVSVIDLLGSSELLDENKTEIECPECNNLIELDWSGDVDDEPSAGGCLGDCHGCHGCGSEDEDDDM